MTSTAGGQSKPRVVSKPVRPLPVERVLPPNVQDTIAKAVSEAGRVTPKLTSRLDRQLAIERTYGVSRRRLANYLRRLADGSMRRPASPRPHARNSERQAPAAPTSGSKDAGGASGEVDEKLVGHRERQATMSSILENMFGPLASSNPELWDRRAYLMLVGLVYEQLATDDVAFQTEELARLAKVLSEARRAEDRPRERGSREHGRSDATAQAGKLPERFTDIVRQVYGTNLEGA